MLHFVQDFYTVRWSSVFLFGVILIDCISQQDMGIFPYDESLSLSVWRHRTTDSKQCDEFYIVLEYENHVSLICSNGKTVQNQKLSATVVEAIHSVTLVHNISK